MRYDIIANRKQILHYVYTIVATKNIFFVGISYINARRDEIGIILYFIY